jgi:hypothetical protein
VRLVRFIETCAIPYSSTPSSVNSCFNALAHQPASWYRFSSVKACVLHHDQPDSRTSKATEVARRTALVFRFTL